MIANANAIFSALCCAIHKKFTFADNKKRAAKTTLFSLR